MIETLDDITTSDLTSAITDPGFLNKLIGALEERIIQYAGWAASSTGELQHKSYKKTKHLISIKREAVKLALLIN